MDVLGQLVSILAMMGIILSFQCKSNRKLIIVMGLGAFLFALSYFLLGQPSAALFNIIAFICSVACLKEKLKNKFVFGFIFLLYALAACYTFEGWWSIVLMLAEVAASYSIMFGTGTFIRNARLFFISPVWLINNTLVCFTIGGTICEIITMASVVISFVRFRKTGFEE